MRMHKNEIGRSMTEMLGMLAIVGILSVSLIVGFDYAISKIEAHRIYKDIKLVYISFFHQLTQTSVWQPVTFDSYSNKQFFIQRDKGNHDFIRVATVEQKVCQSLLDHVQDTQEMTLFSPDGTPLTCQAPEQEIIASFSGVSPLVVCDTGADCPDIYNVYCDASAKECKSCPWTQRADDTHNKCIDLCGDRTDGYTQSCGSDELQANWCCPTNYMCSDQVGMCLDDTVCMYEIETIDKISYRTNCSYKIEEIDKISYRTNCSYTITENDVVAIKDSCPSGFYCYVNWLDETWDEGDVRTIPGADYTGTVYGVCTEMTVTGAPMQNIMGGDVVAVQDNCPSGFYCYVNWLTETWDEGAAMTIPGADYTGMVYGVCTEMTVTGSPMQNMTGGGVKEVVGCKNKSHYCHVKWIDGVLSQTIPGADYTGKAYGKCIAMTTNTVTTSGAVTGVTDFE